MDQFKLDPKVLNSQRYVAVAVDKEKGSQNALRWAADNLLMKGQSVTLIHVNQLDPSSPSPVASTRSSTSTRSSKSGSCDIFDDEPEQLDQSQDLFLPFRVYTSCKDISCDAVVIDDYDIVKALIDYVKLYRIETLVLGASSKYGISRIFNKHDIPSAVLKGAPDFCNVFVISKGKVTFARAAPRPLRSLSLTASRQPNGPRQSFSEESTNFNYSRASSRTVQRVPYGSANPVSEEITNLSTYSMMNAKENGTISEALELKNEVSSLHEDNMKNSRNMRSPCRRTISTSDYSESLSVRKPSKCLSTNSHDLDSILPEVQSDDNAKRKSSDIKSGEHKLTSRKEIKKKPLTPQKIEALEEKMRLMELQMKQTMDMYHAACKDALKEKQKNKDLQRKLVEALMAKEEAMRLAAVETSEVAQTEADKKTQKRNATEKELLKEDDEPRISMEDYF